ncbi:hypothetical protein T07_6276 [Trichinella nelsoni]|uniref:Uncharacterized protein n=1 Tax=Trichinella nelsoni TaxID=6336 RepID=A0A0V0SK19_9BILA|nr:hypothetical protein T07_6276 [Trichinella nelsoni]
MAAAFKRAKQLRRVKLSAYSVNNAALKRVDQQFYGSVPRSALYFEIAAGHNHLPYPRCDALQCFRRFIVDHRGWKSVGLSLDEKKLQVTLRANPNLQLHLVVLLTKIANKVTLLYYNVFSNFLAGLCSFEKQFYLAQTFSKRKQSFLPFKWKQARRQFFYSVLQLISSDIAVNMGWPFTPVHFSTNHLHYTSGTVGRVRSLVSCCGGAFPSNWVPFQTDDHFYYTASTAVYALPSLPPLCGSFPFHILSSSTLGRALTLIHLDCTSILPILSNR